MDEKTWSFVTNVILLVLLAAEQYLGSSKCRSNSLLQLVYNNLLATNVCLKNNDGPSDSEASPKHDASIGPSS